MKNSHDKIHRIPLKKNPVNTLFTNGLPLCRTVIRGIHRNGFDVGIFTAIKLLRLTHKRSLELSDPAMTDERVFRCSFPAKTLHRLREILVFACRFIYRAASARRAEKYDIFSVRARLGKSFNVLKWRSVVSYVAAIFLWSVSFC